MSKTKDKHFDEINSGMEKAKLVKCLSEYPVRSDFSPVLLAKEFYGKFYLTEKEIFEVVKGYYKF